MTEGATERSLSAPSASFSISAYSRSLTTTSTLSQRSINIYCLRRRRRRKGQAQKPCALGQTPEPVEAILGKPEKIVDLGQKKVYIYKDMKIVFVDSKVADVQ